jgi:hypothetical protein
MTTEKPVAADDIECCDRRAKMIKNSSVFVNEMIGI